MQCFLNKHQRADRNQAVWEMTQLIIAPKKVFRNIYYHVSHFSPAAHYVMC